MVKRFQSRFNYSETKREFSLEKEIFTKKQIEELRIDWVAPPTPGFVGECQDDFLDLSFTPEELLDAISHVRIKSSPIGLDCIDYIVLRKLSPLAKCILLHIFNSVLREGVFPAEWRRYLVAFIPEANSRKFRPISMASCVCKLMERMINNRPNWWPEVKEKLPNSQFGFQKDSAVAAAFLDIRSAYDNVLVDILINNMVKLGIPP